MKINAAGSEFSFGTRIVPILTKSGCNAGACHGAATGQGGFKLSLLGYDPEQDYETITREFGGRRINLAAAPQSLLLRKATSDLEHEGGRRIARGSEAYKAVHDWIASGAAYGSHSIAVTNIQLGAEELLLLKPGESKQLRVTAAFSDGSKEEVTRWALFSPNDDGIATVDKEGMVTVNARGVTAIMVRYLGQVAAVRVGAPYQDGNIAIEFPARNFIDERVLAELKRLRLPPSALSSDDTFLRRVYLDVAGRLPLSEEVKAFMASSAPDRRERVIDRLIDGVERSKAQGMNDPSPSVLLPVEGRGKKTRDTSSASEVPNVAKTRDSNLPLLKGAGRGEGKGDANPPSDIEMSMKARATSGASSARVVTTGGEPNQDFIDFWTLKLADLLLINSKKHGESGARAYYSWLREQVARNTPLDRVARELLIASGDASKNGPANFHRQTSDPRDMGEFVSQTLLGTRVACARCHNHPFDRWTMNDYYDFAAFFARTGMENERIVQRNIGEVQHPKTAKDTRPRALGVATFANERAGDRRIALADWLTSPENSMFARAFVNRVWKELMGRGLVEPADDLRSTNPASNPALLDALAADFVKQEYDLRKLVRTIATSRTYQLSSQANDINRQDERHFSHAYIKPLTAQVLTDAIAQVTGAPDNFAGYDAGTRAVQLVDAQVASYTLDVFGRCPRTGPCESPGQSGGGLSSALHMVNGPAVNAKTDTAAKRLLETHRTHRGLIEELYLRALSRMPTAKEIAYCEKLIAEAESSQKMVEDMLWALLNSREFMYNH